MSSLLSLRQRQTLLSIQALLRLHLERFRPCILVMALLKVVAYRGCGVGHGESRRCTHCQRINHVADRCWELHSKPVWAPYSSSLSVYMFDSNGSSGILSSPPASKGSFTALTTAKSHVLLNREEYDPL